VLKRVHHPKGYANVSLLESVLTCNGMECGIDEGNEHINARSVELQKKFNLKIKE
jgi:hypothetical protein